MFETLALIGGFWFFCFIIFIVGLGIVAESFDSPLGAVATFIITLMGLQFLFGFSVWSSIVANPLVLVLALAIYIVIGLCYAVIYKYSNFLKKNEDDIKSEWIAFSNQYDDPVTKEDFMNSSYYLKYTPSQNADRIAAWVALWPWGLLWDVISKPTIWLYNNIYSLAGKLLDSVGKKFLDRILKNK